MDRQKNKDFSLFAVIRKFGGDKARNMPLCLIVSALGGALAVLPYYLIWRLIGHLVRDFSSLTWSLVTRYAVLIFITQVGAACLNLAASVLSHKLAFRLENNLRRVQVSHLLDLPAGYFAGTKSGRLRRLIDDNASRTHQLVAHVMPDFAAAITGPIVLLILILTVDLRFGLISILGIVLAILSLSRMMARGNKERMDKYFIAGEQLGATGTEFFRGIPVVKVFNQSVHSMRAFVQSIKDYSDLCLAFSFGSRIPMIFYTVSLYLPTLAVLPLASYLMARGEHPLLIFSSCLFYVVVTQLFNGSFMRLMTVTSATQSYNLVGEKIQHLLKQDPLPVLTKSPQEIKTDQTAEIVLQDVSYTYPGRDTYAVQGLNFTFEKGKQYALVGASGSGKSTLIKLVARYADPQQGTIAIRGRDIRTLSEAELYRDLAIVFQENKLFKASLRDNLAMGQSYTDAALMEALEQANATDILDRFEHGLDTLLGAQGTYLSGGEVQRVAIARAFLKPASILLLDEATAAADLQNEARIYASLERLKAGKTTLMITHRLNNVRKADEILVMDRGRIIASGTHDQLVASCPHYVHLYDEYRRALDWRIEKGA